MNKILFCSFRWMLTVFAGATALVAADNFPKAELEEASADLLPTPYRVRVTFKDPMPVNQITPAMFKVIEADTGTPVAIISVRKTGGQPKVATGVILDARLSPALAYNVTMAMPDGSFVEMTAVALEQADPGKKFRLIDIGKRFFSLTINPFVTEGGDGIGLDYDVKYSIKNFQIGSGRVRVNLQSHGELSLTSEGDSQRTIQSSLNGGLDGSYMRNFHANLPLGSESRTYAYPLGFKISPAEFEMNKEFTLVDYTAKFKFGSAIPYLDYPAVWWSKAFQLEVPFEPPTLFSGLALVKDVKDDGSDHLAKLGHTRWDTQFSYHFPLHNQLDFKFSWHWYVGVEESFYRNSQETAFLVYINKARTQGFTLSYSRGALPPEFLKTQSWRIGYIGEF